MHIWGTITPTMSGNESARISITWTHGGKGAPKTEMLEIREGESPNALFDLAASDADIRTKEGTITTVKLITESGKVKRGSRSYPKHSRFLGVLFRRQFEKVPRDFLTFFVCVFQTNDYIVLVNRMIFWQPDVSESFPPVCMKTGNSGPIALIREEVINSACQYFSRWLLIISNPLASTRTRSRFG